ncbi:hypothetical protein STAS_22172 [Striga asiatica]|uniref:Uncharacterized protein n=1 Tax=Striga asiatica TaxID=4170 RepID=A0A5A7QK51_STRAF|nr:hypothetical protein STAS_22172 [Striga asiatica]
MGITVISTIFSFPSISKPNKVYYFPSILLLQCLSKQVATETGRRRRRARDRNGSDTEAGQKRRGARDRDGTVMEAGDRRLTRPLWRVLAAGMRREAEDGRSGDGGVAAAGLRLASKMSNLPLLKYQIHEKNQSFLICAQKEHPTSPQSVHLRFLYSSSGVLKSVHVRLFHLLPHPITTEDEEMSKSSLSAFRAKVEEIKKKKMEVKKKLQAELDWIEEETSDWLPGKLPSRKGTIIMAEFNHICIPSNCVYRICSVIAINALIRGKTKRFPPDAQTCSRIIATMQHCNKDDSACSNNKHHSYFDEYI